MMIFWLSQLTIIWQLLDIKIWIWSFVTATWLWLMAMTTSGGSKKEWGFSGSGEPIECHLLGWIGLVRPQLKLWSPVCKDDRSNRSFSVVHYTLTFCEVAIIFEVFYKVKKLLLYLLLNPSTSIPGCFQELSTQNGLFHVSPSVSVKMPPLLHLGCRP